MYLRPVQLKWPIVQDEQTIHCSERRRFFASLAQVIS